MIDNKYINHFLCVSRKKSITLSCEELDITQPALTRSIKRLEDEVGYKLFIRMSRGVELTPEGEVFYQYAEKIEYQLRIALKKMSSIESSYLKKIIIGADNLWAEHYLNDILDDFYEIYPDIQVRVIGGPVKPHLGSLLDGKIDLILGSTDFSMAQSHEISKRKLCNVKYRVIANIEHPLNLQKNITISNLIDYPWVIYQHSNRFVWDVNELFESNGLPKPHVALHTSFLLQAIKHLQRTNSLMFIPEELIASMSVYGIDAIENLDAIHSMDTGYIVLQSSTEQKEISTLLKLIEAAI